MSTQFAAIPLEMFEDERIKPLDIVIYVALHSFTDREGFAWPSIKGIAERGKLSCATIKRSLPRLEAAGYIVKQQRRMKGKKEFDNTIYKLPFRGNVGSDRANVGSVGANRLALTELGVGSERARHHNHITITNKPIPPTPQTGGPHPPTGEFSGKLSPSEGSLSETDLLTSAETKTKDNPQKTKDKGGRGSAAGGGLAKKAHDNKVDANFLDFWEAYPKKDGEAGARCEWRKLFPFGCDDAEHRATLERVSGRLEALLTRFVGGDLEPRFVPKAQNWLKDEDWSHD